MLLNVGVICYETIDNFRLERLNRNTINYHGDLNIYLLIIDRTNKQQMNMHKKPLYQPI